MKKITSVLLLLALLVVTVPTVTETVPEDEYAVMPLSDDTISEDYITNC